MPEETLAARAADDFAAVFGGPPQGVWAAPGRVNVIGEHTDYNGGFVLPTALPHTTRAALALRTDGLLRIASVQQPGDVVEVPVAGLRPGHPGGWAGYVGGVVHELPAAVAGGLSVLVDGDVPAGAGLSSSAALECAVALGLRDLLGLDLDTVELVDVARRAENDFVGAPTGLMDQSASLLCTAGHALFLDTRSREARQVPLDLASAGLELLVLDTGTRHAHADGGYGERRRQCEEATAALGVAALRDVPDVAALDALADDVLRRRARHIVTEDARVLEVVRLLDGGGDPRGIGPLLTAGHASLRDDFEISTPELDVCVAAALGAGAHGARMFGGGFGGSAVALVDVADADRVVRAVTERFDREGYTAPAIVTAVPSAGARRLR
ncbi:galactokinase [Modestobacter sp. I12A-02628]|uniref:Galactokinase n=1 Tax=Goekera deserti TaxID=2497753 RepID=A0A7K3WJ43_9ACTN|nr:galactokinase [Goekera deserti]NDI50172.1 galactokinase [Goekera deserti]NEL55740.1 galactokinase [Goekera deserti]